MGDRALIEELIAVEPVVESPMGSEGCMWCESVHDYSGPSRPVLHEWTCAWMRANQRCGTLPLERHGWGERTWRTAWIDDKGGNPRMFGDIPRVGDWIAFIADIKGLEDGLCGTVIAFDGIWPVIDIDDDATVDFEGARKELWTLPSIVWCDLNIEDPRSAT